MQADAQEGVHTAQHHPSYGSCQQADPGRSALLADDESSQGADQHHPLYTEVQNSSALGQQFT
jgi:hypothetical protein